MRRYTFGFLRDYYSARGWTLTRGRVGRKMVYCLTNGAKTMTHTFVGLPSLREYALTFS